jgi:flagellar basal body rod protein FlgF
MKVIGNKKWFLYAIFGVCFISLGVNALDMTAPYDPEKDPLIVDKSDVMMNPRMDAALTYPTQAMPVYEEHFNAFEAYTANQMTPGYKEYSFGNVSKEGMVYGRKFFRLGQGPPIETGQPLDVYVEGKAFFVIQGPFGQGYTRDGRFVIDSYGRLATFSDYFLVMGENGPIVLDSPESIYINSEGEIFRNERMIDKIRLVQFANLGEIDSFNSHIFYPINGPNAVALEENPKYYIRQGFYEGSAVVKGLIGEVPRFKHGYLASAYTVQRALKMYQTALTMGSP